MSKSQTQSSDPRAADVAASATFAPLLLRNESNSEFIVVDQPSAILGRRSDADVRLVAPDVSRRHCRLFFDGGHWKVQDLSSLNGVYVNDDPVRIAPLHRGDTLRLGVTAYVVEHGAARQKKTDTLRSIEKALT